VSPLTASQTIYRVDDLQFVVWNVNRHDRAELVSQIATDKHADIVILLENEGKEDATLQALQDNTDASFILTNATTKRIGIFCRNPKVQLDEIYADANGRVTIRRFKFAEQFFLVVAAHLPSKLNWAKDSQAIEVQELARTIRHHEGLQSNSRTILVGDLNMNPFETGMIGAAGLHAMMTKATVTAGSRIVQGKEYSFFYNPMWTFFGDLSNGPPGTYYYRDSSHTSFEWNMFDQVLVRPLVVPFLSHVEITTKAGDIPLADLHGRPDKDVASDHFPIAFTLRNKETDDVSAHR